MDQSSAVRATIIALSAAAFGIAIAACGGSAPPANDPTGAGGSGASTAPVGGATGPGATSAAPTSLPADPTTATPPPATGGGGGGW
jgi:hypothetical protein